MTQIPITAGVARQALKLISHPALPCGIGLEVFVGVQVQPVVGSPSLELQFELCGGVDRILLPAANGTQPADGLWQHTCAELFVRTEGNPTYQEFNFSPSGQWAAYRFSSERQRDRQAEFDHPALPPTIRVRAAAGSLRINILLPLQNLPPAANDGLLRLGLSMVTERDNGELAYWALHHPRSDRPDFHHQDGCVLTLPLLPSVENLL
ncbi:DOMON-like domain-containing protein [Hydrogenophaga sp. PAMC20947]|uniref:DOMON-like domain-containing protein n=1 Tax=Hydrogenophaga sp. PAMC20947 TaxID=2565558 RepID=UPI00109DDBA0|nr:DOMON-like domain-containing protein [Hydrogenophaga sp. PAMC20947]QCB45664.1 DOMON-like domain-containing protein [Hydrogenophaga sp. PAMC20947]